MHTRLAARLTMPSELPAGSAPQSGKGRGCGQGERLHSYKGYGFFYGSVTALLGTYRLYLRTYGVREANMDVDRVCLDTVLWRPDSQCWYVPPFSCKYHRSCC